MKRLTPILFAALSAGTLAAYAIELPPEQPYDFRKRLDVIHEPGLRDAALKAEADEFAIADGAVVAVGAGAPALVVRAAGDFVEFLQVSMSVDARVESAFPASAAVTVKVDPTPFSLVTSIVPPIISTKFLVMAMPRPLPP